MKDNTAAVKHGRSSVGGQEAEIYRSYRSSLEDAHECFDVAIFGWGCISNVADDLLLFMYSA